MRPDERKEKERKGAAVPLALGRASPGGGFSGAGSLLKGLLASPNAWMARGLLGAAMAVSAAWLTSSIWADLRVPPARLEPTHPVDRTLFRPDAPGPRSLLGGLGFVIRPEGLLDAPSGGISEQGDAEAGSPSPADPSDAPQDSASQAQEAGKAEEQQEEKGADGGGPAPGAPGLQSAGGLGSAPGAGSGAQAGGGASGAAGAGSEATDASGPLGALDRGRTAAASRGGKIGASSLPRGRTNAIKQLRFAKDMSVRANRSPSMESGYSAAQTAFSGQTAGSGTPVPGAGVTQGGPGMNSRPPGTSAPASAGNVTCPSGYFLNGSVCSPMADRGGNVTPYQDSLDNARKFLILAAVLAAAGLALLAFGGLPLLQILGGILLGLALALILASAVIGDKIKQNYCQKTQGEAIERAGVDASRGQAPK